MKVSEISVTNVADYLKLNTGDYSVGELQAILTASKTYISQYTGIPIESTESKTLDDYEDFYIAVMVLCQDMHDNRSLYVDNKSLNKVVSTILDMHCTNLLPTPDEVAI